MTSPALEALKNAVKAGLADSAAGRYTDFNSSQSLTTHLKSLATKALRQEQEMTIPYERTRALLEANLFLHELQNPQLTPRVPAAVRELACKLTRHYPSYADIEAAHKALPHLFGPVPPFSRAHMKTAITELGLDKLGSKE